MLRPAGLDAQLQLHGGDPLPATVPGVQDLDYIRVTLRDDLRDDRELTGSVG